MLGISTVSINTVQSIVPRQLIYNISENTLAGMLCSHQCSIHCRSVLPKMERRANSFSEKNKIRRTQASADKTVSF